MNLNELLLIDIETIPQHDSYDKLDKGWQKLWQEKSSRYQYTEPTTPEESYNERAGILAEFGKIICISTAYYFTDVNKQLFLKQKTLSNNNEIHLLNDFLLLCESFLKVKKTIAFAGHNIKEFDIPYICRRLIINNIKLPKFLNIHGQKPWDNHSLDTLHWWRFGDYKNYISLKLLAASLNIPSSKEEIDGSQVRNVFYNENGLDKIAKYCAQDVQVVAQIILKFANKPLLEEECFIK
jgi:3'-5' exonuclease